MIDSSKDTLNINDINTSYLLRIATYVKNEFQNLQFKFEVYSLKVEKVIVMVACLKNSEMFYRTNVSILLWLKTLTLQFKMT